MRFNYSLQRKLIVISAMLSVVGLALAEVVEAASLRLTWNDRSSNESGFAVQRQAADGSFVQLATVSANVTSYTDSGLTSGRTYCYTVRAFNSAGSSDPTNAACATTATTSGGGSGGPSSSGGASSAGFNTVLTLSNNSDSGSTRGSVMTGDQIMIGGFIIEGSQPTIVLIRGRGPSMGDKPFFVPGTLSNPQLQLYSGSTLIAQNDNWQDSPQCDSQFVCGGAAQILATSLDPCEANPGQQAAPAGCAFESAILAILPPGGYTAVLTGVNGGTGVGLVEVFEIDGSANPSKLVNVSTRSVVQSQDDPMIGGVILTGPTSKTVLIRGRGPSMAGAPFHVAGTLANPYLQLFSGSTVIAQNDNWQDSPQCDSRFACGGGAQITATGLDPCQPNPGQSAAPQGCSQEAAFLITLPPGAYTAILRGADGGTGVGLVEIFDMN
jgi:hypothetical protein